MSRGLDRGYTAGGCRNGGSAGPLTGRLPLSGKEMPWASVRVADTD